MKETFYFYFQILNIPAFFLMKLSQSFNLSSVYLLHVQDPAETIVIPFTEP